MKLQAYLREFWAHKFTTDAEAMEFAQDIDHHLRHEAEISSYTMPSSSDRQRSIESEKIQILNKKIKDLEDQIAGAKRELVELRDERVDSWGREIDDFEYKSATERNTS